MRWSERQRAMLREMGIPPFWPVEADAVDAAPSVSPSPTLAENLLAAEPLARAPQHELNSNPTAEPTEAPSGAASRQATPRPGGLKPVGAVVAKMVEQGVDSVARPARPAGIESMDWPALREAVTSCQACALCDSRTQTVFGVGNIEAQWMIVGEAPGEQEDRQGEPFVGKAGQLLDRMLGALDLTRSDSTAAKQVYIANVLKCRPPANRNPLLQEVAQCEPYLLRQVALVKPRVILAMGKFAVQSLLKSQEAIGRLRGRVHHVDGIPVVVTYHPAYLLRNPADKALAWADLCLAHEIWRASQDESDRA